MVREPPQLSGERGEERVADRGFGREQLAELGPRQDERLRRLEGRCRRRARCAVQERELAEDIAGPQGRQDRLVPGVGRQHDLDRPGHDDEQGVAGVAEVEDDFAPPEAAASHPLADPFEARRVQPGEERNAGEGFGQWAGRDHSRILPPRRR